MWLLSLRHTGAFVGARQEPSCCGFATAGAEIGRPAHIVASRRKKLGDRGQGAPREGNPSMSSQLTLEEGAFGAAST
jgi:hypothetical protein